MNPWSAAFVAFLTSRDLSQIAAVVEMRVRGLRVTQSQVHYWSRGSVPRVATRREIEDWSGGAVPAALAGTADESGEHPAVEVPSDTA